MNARNAACLAFELLEVGPKLVHRLVSELALLRERLECGIVNDIAERYVLRHPFEFQFEVRFDIAVQSLDLRYLAAADHLAHVIVVSLVKELPQFRLADQDDAEGFFVAVFDLVKPLEQF